MFNIKISHKAKISVLLLIVAALSVSYIMNKQISAFISLLLLSGLAYALSKNIVMSLAISIIFTNLLLSMNYFVVEGLQGSQSIIGNSTGPPKNITQGLNALQAKYNENNASYKQ
jgi:hypothetical protein